jgi:hypothetical protein
MSDRPHDVTDSYLAPVLLAVDARLEELGQLDKGRLAYEVALESDLPDVTRQMREEALMRAVTRLTDTHHWTFSWDPRGLRMTHDAHTSPGLTPDLARALPTDQDRRRTSA